MKDNDRAAIRDLSLALRLGVEVDLKPLAYTIRGKSHLALGHIDAAKADCIRALRLDPGSKPARQLRELIQKAIEDQEDSSEPVSPAFAAGTLRVG